jgi:hypothetical protein
MRRFGDYASFFDFILGYAGKSDPWRLAPVLKFAGRATMCDGRKMLDA